MNFDEMFPPRKPTRKRKNKQKIEADNILEYTLKRMPVEQPNKKKKKNPEGQLQKQILAMLNSDSRVAMVRRWNSGVIQTKSGAWVKMGLAGDPDIMGMFMGGLFFAIEVKVGSNKPTEKQQQRLNQINRDGGVACWVNSLEAAKEFLDTCTT